MTRIVIDTLADALKKPGNVVFGVLHLIEEIGEEGQDDDEDRETDEPGGV